MAWDYRKMLTGATSGALQAAPTANPYLIAGNAALQALIGGASGREPFDPQPFRDQFSRYKRRSLADTRPYMDEVGSQAGQSLAARGLGDSPLAVGIAQGNRRKVYQDVLRGLNKEESALEKDLMTAGLVDRRQREDEWRRELGGLTKQAGNLVNQLATRREGEAQGLEKIRGWLGMEKPQSTTSAGSGLNQRRVSTPSTPSAPPGPAAPESPSSPYPKLPRQRNSSTTAPYLPGPSDAQRYDGPMLDFGTHKVAKNSGFGRLLEEYPDQLANIAESLAGSDKGNDGYDRLYRLLENIDY